VSVTPRVVFGAGAVAHLPTELGRLSLSSPLIVSSPSRIGLARHIQELIPNFDSRILDSALVSVPARVVDDAVARITGRDCVVSVGGATALGLAKSIAACKGIPHICIPTTYSGSEVGPVLSEARRRARRRRHRHTDKSTSGTPSVSTASVSKGTDHDAKMLPNVIIYDEDLTASAPRRFSAPTCVEAMASSRCRRAPGDEDAQWSYIHLPGV
jgi:alcohol dehydrogenase class IV